ncbi:Carbonic anhydrase [Lentilactobacillus hilgardii]|uniref:carbonic anhydrase family protein n=1 Tax=Lentilactobacillus hilgardii TaxID=1588 RepID=UPI00019C5225|nr:carbonic anhydrase family protein [Lentilactobacillus hilgardii]EEI20164.1 carbonate dehydratase, eukaryotic-type [Lentilactobacillus buchneri ATCC 11577]MCT3397014.1 carbonic anhydrase family protein [Lentilactobacillus hilgardii]QIR08828.1 Carbonic anhydrase [Lentilactobacillus hilgardii]
MLDYNAQSQWSNGFGGQQSPVDLKGSEAVQHKGSLLFEIKNSYDLISEIDDQTTIRVLGNGSAAVFGRSFDFVQVHFHVPAEHLVDGEAKPFEIHLVHQNKIGQLVVVALLVSEGKEDATLQQIIDQFQAGRTKSVNIQLEDWVPARPTGFHYLGSLTTPPLTEGVEWLVITNPNVSISADQLAWFKAHFQPNNRETQDLNGRLIGSYLK